MISVCIPIYKGSKVLKQAIESIINQDYIDFEIIMTDDNNSDDENEIKKTLKIIKSFDDTRIKYFKNKRNLGYALNLKKTVSLSTGEIIFLFAQDDILAKGILSKVNDIFKNKEVGVLTRPYVWFFEHPSNIIRSIEPYNKEKDEILDIMKNEYQFYSVCQSVGQLSGLAYRKEYLQEPFDNKCFTAHIYPFLDICKRYKCAFLKDYSVAVRIETSQTRHISDIYNPSPTASWIMMFNHLYKDHKNVKKWGYRHICNDHLALVQIKNYAPIKYWFKEVYILAKNYPINIINPKFWFFVIGTLVIPRKTLRFLVDFYKNKINAKKFKNIKFA